MSTTVEVSDMTLSWSACLNFYDEDGVKLGGFGLLPNSLTVRVEKLPDELRETFDKVFMPYLEQGSLELLQERYDHRHRE